ncbi:Putative peptidase family protein [Neorhodopirellula lusitana]|uniref:Peptidase family protein n=1 Tax=Neorhodopirellula lusitana TaxID=445327 RepID=A0ABY1Q418_9BACT|nr:metallopeptidase [Neorhodopirellula lusitana]SMP54379.1 Putative peptidase family protein [Neorhodopirellula lusitana]
MVTQHFPKFAIRLAFTFIFVLNCNQPAESADHSNDSAKLVVENHEPNSTVRYSVILLRGTLPTQTSDFKIINANAPASAGTTKVVTRDGNFKALVELSPGRNELQLSGTGIASLTFPIHYTPQTNPQYIRLVWMTDKGGDTNFATPTDDVAQNYEARLRTAALLMQSFTAERMHELGYGRRTFRLERDEAGEVIVHTWKGPLSREEYYALGDSNRWWHRVRQWIDQDHTDAAAKNVVLAAYTRKDPTTGRMKGHTALGGANLGLFGSASVFSWPQSISQAAIVFQNETQYDTSKIHDDSVSHSAIWGLASTTIGATLHETGHALGLPHCPDRFGIMSRGFDHFNRFATFQDPRSRRNRNPVDFNRDQEAYFAPESASYLRWSPWMQLDASETASSTRPTIEVNDSTIQVHCESGIGWIGFHAKDQIRAFREFAPGELPTTVTLKRDEIDAELKGIKLQQIRAISSDGVESGKRI